MTPDLLSMLISAIVGGGLATGLASLLRALSEQKKVPADINLTVLGGAEKALQVMKAALDEAEERLVQLKAEMLEERQRHREDLKAKDAEIRNLQENIHIIREQFNNLAIQLDRLQREAQEVRDGNNHKK